MAITKTSPKQFLGAQIPNVKILSSKIDEIIDDVNGTSGTVTQLTSITTGVTVNATKGVITTVSLTTAAGAAESPFVVTNSKVVASSIIITSVEYASGKTGFPVVLVEAVAAGSFGIRILNAKAAGALNDIVKIHFQVIN